MKKIMKEPEDYLKEPYSRILIPDEENGTYTALILEFPGCIAQGDTPSEAYEHLEDSANDWIKTAINLQQEIPSPSQSMSFGGRILLRLPKSLHRQLSITAHREGVSLNQFIVYSLAEKIGSFSLYEKVTKKLDQRICMLAMNIAANTVEKYLNIDPVKIGWKEEVRSNAGDQTDCFFLQGSGRSTHTI
ncbi:toxin-antitoxin system HicB family antitoxin [Desulfobacca acetoxidans]